MNNIYLVIHAAPNEFEDKVNTECSKGWMCVTDTFQMEFLDGKPLYTVMLSKRK